MKKLLTGLILLLCILSFCGCSRTEPSVDAPPVPADEYLSSPPRTLMTDREPTGSLGNAYVLSCPALESLYQPRLTLMGDDILVWSQEDGKLSLRLVSVESGELLSEASLSTVGSATVQTGSGLVGICDSLGGTVSILDSDFKLIRQYTLEPAGSWYLAGDMETLYQISDSGLSCTQLKNGKSRELISAAYELNIQGVEDRALIFSYIDGASLLRRWACLDLDSAELLSLDDGLSASSLSHSDGLWLLGDVGHWGHYRLLSTGSELVLDWKGNSLRLVHGGKLLSRDLLGRELCLYNSDGAFLSRFRLDSEGSSLATDILYSERWQGWLIMSRTAEGQHQLIFWDEQVPVSGDSLGIISPAPSGALPADRGLNERADSMAQLYDVEIALGEQCQLRYDSYSALASTDTEELSQALGTLEQALERYPQGFFPQLLHGDMRRISFQMVSSLTPVDDPELVHAAAGVTEFSGDSCLIMLETSGLTEETIHHEIAHVIEQRLSFSAALRPEALYSEDGWRALQPEGFDYAWSYAFIPEGTQAYYDSGYFVSRYSCTFPGEDWACTFAAAVSGRISADSPRGILEKLSYLSLCIRDGMDCSSWPERCVWENPLY